MYGTVEGVKLSYSEEASLIEGESGAETMINLFQQNMFAVRAEIEVGFRALTAQKMKSIDRRIEPNRTHVHCTPLEAFVDFGWLGAAAWALWTFLVFRCAVRLARTGGELAAAPLCMLLSLALFGFIEYNLADASVVVFYGMLMGLAAARYRTTGI